MSALLFYAAAFGATVGGFHARDNERTRVSFARMCRHTSPSYKAHPYDCEREDNIRILRATLEGAVGFGGIVFCAAWLVNRRFSSLARVRT